MLCLFLDLLACSLCLAVRLLYSSKCRLGYLPFRILYLLLVFVHLCYYWFFLFHLCLLLVLFYLLSSLLLLVLHFFHLLVLQILYLRGAVLLHLFRLSSFLLLRRLFAILWCNWCSYLLLCLLFHYSMLLG